MSSGCEGNDRSIDFQRTKKKGGFMSLRRLIHSFIYSFCTSVQDGNRRFDHALVDILLGLYLDLGDWRGLMFSLPWKRR